ncbi:toxin YdaT family protein [Cupriavidus numazuensis]|uniref:toxin YdaT family protein n=1 Tax=Cupriavidus numazuensis TaxID=221992 RepID=UPI001BA5C347|nr:toxin YdaT family protein [Cupriavidus numazuensis]
MIGLLRASVTTWRTRERWGRETVAQEIVITHESLGVGDRTGIRFDPRTPDAYERMKVNADRIFRWLDDETKDNALLPANFIPTILAALPGDLRLKLLGQLLAPFGLTVRPLCAGVAAELQVPLLLAAMLKEDSEAHLAVTSLMSDASLEALRTAYREVSEAVASQQGVLRHIEAAMASHAFTETQSV